MIIAIGQTFVMSTSGIDLSVSAVAQLSGVVLGAVAVGAGLPIGIGILIALAVGALAGALNGLIIAQGRSVTSSSPSAPSARSPDSRC